MHSSITDRLNTAYGNRENKDGDFYPILKGKQSISERVFNYFDEFCSELSLAGQHACI